MQYSRTLKPFSLIVAIDHQGGIGLQQTLPWKIAADMAFFRHVTTTAPFDFEGALGLSQNVVLSPNAVIMGRKTWLSLPKKHRPLRDRYNVVLSRGMTSIAGAPVVCGSLVGAMALPEVCAAPEVFVIGGAEVFSEAIDHPCCTRLILTRIAHDFGCDAFFPAIPPRFVCAKTSEWRMDENASLRFRFEVWEILTNQ